MESDGIEPFAGLSRLGRAACASLGNSRKSGSSELPPADTLCHHDCGRIPRMPTYRLTIEYEGTRYRGWQQQENARTVAGELIRAIEQAAEEAIELMGAGRTDAGVHALAQVAHLRLARTVEPQRFRDDVNTLLPPDIHVLSLQQAPERFHARHS